MAYVTAATFKTFKGITTSGDDSLISSLIDRAEAWFNRECGRVVVAEADSTRYIDALGDHIRGRVLYLYGMGDLCGITTLTNGDGVALASNEYTTYPKTLTFSEPTIREIRILGSANKAWTYTTDWENAITIVGKWGLFPAASVPADITNAIVRLTAYLYKVKDTDAFETTVVPFEGVIQAPQGFPVDVGRLVNLLRKP